MEYTEKETLVELLERRFVTADGTIIWNEQVKGLIDGAINRASKNCIKPVIKSVCDYERHDKEIKEIGECRSCGKREGYSQTVL